METKQIPVTVYAEITPNPATVKFVANKYLVTDPRMAEYLSPEEAVDSSPLAEELFRFPFVKSVFIAANFVAVTKNESTEWDYITMELREFIVKYLKEGKPVITNFPEPREEPKSNKPTKERKPAEASDYDQQIKDLLEEYVKPAVARDGGAIDFYQYKDGVVTVLMKGACAGCPSSTQTLKGGIENLLKQYIPEIKGVVAEDY